MCRYGYEKISCCHGFSLKDLSSISSEDVSDRHRILAKHYHTDKNSKKDAYFMTLIMTDINNAREIFTDDAQKNISDNFMIFKYDKNGFDIALENYILDIEETPEYIFKKEDGKGLLKPGLLAIAVGLIYYLNKK